jgi:SAM-dependent methyltransferase
MYNLIKKLVYQFVPKKMLIKNELFIRRVGYQFYKGNKHQCPICTKTNRSFQKNQRGENLCPNCGSMPRDRRLFTVFKHEISTEQPIRLLDFSPSRSLYRTFSNWHNIHYFPSDLSTDFIAEYQYDITNIPTENNYFDAVICFHILEHVDNDILAMKELYRVLQPTGIALVQTPFKEGEIYENPEIISPQDRLKHFGQEDHVRIYSVAGLTERLKSVGFTVEQQTFDEDDYFGLNKGDIVLKLTKN